MIQKINVYNQKVYVAGGVHDKLDKIENFIQQQDHSDIFIINGNICYPSDKATANIEKLINLMSQYNIYYVLGDKDLLYQKKLYDNNQFNIIYNWINSQHLACQVNFGNGASMIILNGGIPKDFYEHNIKLCLLKNNWHDSYHGEIGYIVSNNPPCNGSSIDLYKYSCSIGTSDGSEDQKSIIQQISHRGLENIYWV